MSLNYNFIWLLCYLLVLVGLAGYGFHRLSIVYLYWKNRNNKPQPKSRFQELPVVTVQLPMFNEKFVVDRLLESVAALDYPQDKLEIQSGYGFHRRHHGTVLPQGGGTEGPRL